MDKPAFVTWLTQKYDAWFLDRQTKQAPRLLKHFAEYIGLPFDTVRAWLTTKESFNSPTFEQLQILIARFGVSELLPLFTTNDYRIHLIIQAWGNLTPPARHKLFQTFLQELENNTQPLATIKMQ